MVLGPTDSTNLCGQCPGLQNEDAIQSSWFHIMETNSDYSKAKSNLSKRCGVDQKTQTKLTSQTQNVGKIKGGQTTAKIMTLELYIDPIVAPLFQHHC